MALLMPSFTLRSVAHRIGLGGFRNVVETPDPIIVRKLPESKMLGKESNLIEWRVWNLVKDTDLAKYFVPCLDCAPDGSWLDMERVVPMINQFGPDINESELRKDKQNPFYAEATKALKEFGIRDIKPDNRAKDGRILDYGIIGYELLEKLTPKEVIENG